MQPEHNVHNHKVGVHPGKSPSATIAKSKSNRVAWGSIETIAFEVDSSDCDLKCGFNSLRDHLGTQFDRNTAIAANIRAPPGLRPPTTIVLSGFPEAIDRTYLCGFLNMIGFGCDYDFMYLPMHLNTCKKKGFAYINFVTHAAAVRAGMTLSFWFRVSWSAQCQGLHDLVDDYWNSVDLELVSQATPDAFQPTRFANGAHVELPTSLEQSKSRHTMPRILVLD
jgi:hypothetical protein